MPTATDNLPHLLARAPMLVFLMVAAADGKLDKKELKRFAKLMESPDYRILSAVLANAERSPPELFAEVQAGLADPLAELAALRQALDEGLPPDAARTFKVTLLKFGQEIAEASGGLFGLFGSKVSKEEKVILAAIASGLGLLEEAAPASAPLRAAPAQMGRTPLTPDSIPDNLLPVLKPAEWAATGPDLLKRGLYADPAVRPDEPVVAYAIDHPEAVEFISRDRLAGPLTPELLHERALANLEKRLAEVQWQRFEKQSGIEGRGPVSGLILRGDYYASEALLLPSLLKQAHTRLDSALLMAIAPIRGELFVTGIVSEEAPEPERLLFAAYAIRRFFQAEQPPIASNVFIIRNGHLAGEVKGMERITASVREAVAREAAAQAEKLRHSARSVEASGGTQLVVEVVAEDLELMLRDLQHLLRSYLQEALKDARFSGETRVEVKIADPQFDPERREELAATMDDMFGFLNRQFASLGLKPAGGGAVRLSYQLSV